MKSIAELIVALQQGTLTLSAAADAIAARGALPDAEHRAELALLEQAGQQGQLDAPTVRELLARLVAAQVAAAPDDSFDDATVVKPVMDDATVVKPAARPPPQPPVEATDGTVVKPVPRPPPPEQDEVTIVKPSAVRVPDGTERTTGATGTAGKTGTGTGSSSMDMASWRRIASAEGGEYATVGMLLKGRFLLEREIGRGGMGVVFLARDERKVEARDRDPYVAVKVLNDDFRRHPDSLIALQREARRSQLLAHDNIVRVFDFDKDGTIVFMTMEYIDGSDLKTLIRERAYNGMSLADARPLIEGMAWALKRAHATGVVHSDFKPGNVMVTREGVPKVFDFGIARAAQHAGSDSAGDKTLFDAGTLGALTPAYASLEMIKGQEPAASDDIYALGCVIFELLTGKHPFDKASAEVAQREGRRPPAVPGLTRRQYKTLCDSVAFTREQRLKSAAELIDGLREVTWCQRYGRPFAYGAGVVVLLALGAWGLSRYLHDQQVARVVERFAPTNAQHYANVGQAMTALNGLNPRDRTRIVLEDGEIIQNFLLNRIRSHWNPSSEHYDFAGAERVFQARDQLRLYSPALDREHRAIEQQRNDLLNTLDTQLMERISAGAIFASQPHNVIATMAKIRAMDPTSALLKNSQLELKYDIAIGQSLGSGRIAQAQQQLKLARSVFPDSRRLAVRAQQLAALSSSEQVVSVPTTSRFQTVTQAQTALAGLLATPATTAVWQSQVAAAMVLLQNNQSPSTRHLVDRLGAAIATTVSKQNNALHLPQDIELINFGLRYAPHSAPLLAQRDRLAALQQQQQTRLDQEAATAEIASRIESVRRAAAANDTAKAEQSLARIRALQPSNPFLVKEGPTLVAEAYIRIAQDAFRAGKYQSAQLTVAQGIAALGPRSDLANARDLYALTAALISAHGQPLAPADYQRLSAQLGRIRKIDANGLKNLESELKSRRQLAQGTLSALLESLRPSSLVSTAVQPATPTPSPISTVSKPAAVVPQILPSTLPQPVTSAAVASSPDPCAQAGLAGSGHVCFDRLHDGQRGPLLVVIPGIAGGKPYALSRAEITVNDFNAFCNATHQCKPVALAYSYAGQLPITDINVSAAKAYAHWLSSESGYTYSLPTDAEWLHAARAGVGWKQSPDSNCLPPSSDGNNGDGSPIPALGRQPNPWGLVNMTGNVWEWVLLPNGKLGVRGGSYNSYWSDCTVNAFRSDSGAPQHDVGFRIFRALK